VTLDYRPKAVRLNSQGAVVVFGGQQDSAVALTAFATEKDRELAISAGFQMHLAKPVDPEVLVGGN